MLRRKMLDYLRQWKENHGPECLLINGARQVGKSYIVDVFGQSDYQSYVKIDFIRNPELRAVFDRALDPSEIYSRITLLVPGSKIVPGHTLIFLDEVQECPAARSAFKYLAQDGRCDVIGSGSLLGVRFAETADAPSLPVGYERQVTMRPLDFEEFLWALGYEDEAILALRGYLDRLEPVPQAIHQAMMRRLHEYLVIGGMPAVVAAFVKDADYGAAHDVQTQLHALYLDDVARYAHGSERIKARACYESLPRQLAREDTKFQYSTVEHNGTARKFGNAIDWIVDAGMALECRAVTAPEFPLEAYEDGAKFRLYANDMGLLMAMYDFSMKAAVIENTLKGPMKGGLYENLVATMLVARGKPLHYWKSQNRRYEIEFLVDDGGAVVPIEVKASRGKSASLDALLDHEAVRVGYKLVDGNVGRQGKKVTLPLYMAMFLFDDA